VSCLHSMWRSRSMWSSDQVWNHFDSLHPNRRSTLTTPPPRSPAERAGPRTHIARSGVGRALIRAARIARTDHADEISAQIGSYGLDQR
jgi:hypothetical protein